MDNRITSEEVANQFAKAIQLMLEWAKQEMLVKSPTNTIKPVIDRDFVSDNVRLVANRLLKAKEVAETLQVSRSQVYKMMQLGEIPTVRVGTAVRIRPSDLDEFIKKGKGV
jgi:excisionase family DNA binding protein